MGLLGVRLGFVALCLLATLALVWKFDRVAAGLKRFMYEPQPPLNLGLLRALTFGALLLDTLGSRPDIYAGLPASFIALPQGWSWFGDYLPINVALATWAKGVLIVSSVLAAIGLFTRPAAWIASLSSVYVLGITNFYFKVGHGSHVTVLTALLLAASPCADGFSIDSLIRRLRGKPSCGADAVYTVTVRFAWLLLGTMYLFPGLWKLWDTGDLWLSGDKLRVELFDKWGHMPDYYPTLRIDRSQAVLAVFGTLTLVLEVGFFPALFNRVTRIIAGISAALFHIGIGLTMNIWFHSFQPLVVLFDFPAVLRLRAARPLGTLVDRIATEIRTWLARRVPTTTTVGELPKRSLGGPFVVGSVLVSAMFIAGLSPVDSWPIAVYPRFSSRTTEPRTTSYALRFFVRDPAGNERELKAPFKAFSETEVFRIVRATLRHKKRGRTEEVERHIALLTHMLRVEAGPFKPREQLVIYRFNFTIEPDTRRSERTELSLVAEADL